MSKYTINDFRKEYHNEEACLHKVYTLTYGKLEKCTKCNNVASFTRVIDRRCYQCTKCRHQIYPTKGTIFENTRTPLTYWFYSMFLFTASKNGVSAKEIQRQLGVTYKTAWRMLKQIRLLIKVDFSMLSDVVQSDETFVGGKNKNRHRDKKVARCQGRSFKDKVPVLGLLSSSGQVRCFVINNTESQTIQPIIRRNVAEGTILISDEWKAYNGLQKHYQHIRVNHQAKQYVNENGATTNGIENFWSIVKRTLNGSYIHVSRKYLQLYINECVFRFNNRSNKMIFSTLVNSLSF